MALGLTEALILIYAFWLRTIKILNTLYLVNYNYTLTSNNNYFINQKSDEKTKLTIPLKHILHVSNTQIGEPTLSPSDLSF